MKKTTKTILAILLAAVMALSIAACDSKATPTVSDAPSSETTGGADSGAASSEPGSSSNAPDSAPDNAGSSDATATPAPVSTKDTVTIAVTQDSGTLDPMIISGNDIVYAMFMVYDQLWYTDENGDEIMMLATGREQLDQLTYRIHLREGITFSNGSKFEADDVLYSLDHANNRPGQPGIIPQLDVANSKIIDELTLDVAFSEYRITFMSTIGALCMLDKQTCEADPDALAIKPIGTGPYVMTDYVVNSHVTLKRRDTYWGTMPAIENYNFVHLSEESQRVNAIEVGEVDIADIPYQDIEYVGSLPDVKLNQSQGFMGSGLYFNIAESSVFYENPDARRAVAYAIDRDAINSLAYSKTGSKPNALVDGGEKTTDGDDRLYGMGIYADDYDPDLAKQYAESSGLIGKTVKLINNGSSSAALTCELIQADCKKVGIIVDVVTLDMGTWTTILFDDTQYDMCIDGVPIAGETYAGSFQFCYGYMAAGSYTNYDYPGRDEALQLVAEELTIEDPEKRKDMNYRLMQIGTDEMLWYNLNSPTSALGVAEGLEGEVRNAYNVVSLYRNLYWS